MAASEEPEPLPLAEAPLLKRRSADAAYQRWLLAECTYGVSWQNTEDSLEGIALEGMHCMVDAAHLADALASALASGDSGALARISKSGLRQILYTGRLDLPPRTCRAAAGKSESLMPLCSRLHPFRVGSLLETIQQHSSYAAPPATSVTGMKMVECPRDVMVEDVRGGVSGASITREASTRSSREASTRQATHTSAEEYRGEQEEACMDPTLVLVEELIDGISSVYCVALLYSLLYVALLYSLLYVGLLYSLLYVALLYSLLYVALLYSLLYVALVYSLLYVGLLYSLLYVVLLYSLLYVALLYSLLYVALLYSLLYVVCRPSLFACPRAC
jgi:hypothetical protein